MGVAAVAGTMAGSVRRLRTDIRNHRMPVCSHRMYIRNQWTEAAGGGKLKIN